MSSQTTLINKSFVYSIGNFGPKVIRFLLIPLYTVYLSPEEFGVFDIVMVTVTLLTPFISMMVESSVYRYILDNSDGENITSILSNGFWVVVRNLSVFNVIYIFVGLSLQLRYTWYLLVLLNLSIISATLTQAMRALGKIGLLSMANILGSLVVIGANLYLIIYAGLRVEALLISNIAAYAVVITILINRLKFSSFLNFSAVEKKVRGELLRYSLPLVLSTVSWWVMVASDRYFLTYFCGLEATGLYSIANKFPSFLIIAYLGFASSWQDTAIELYGSEAKNTFYSKVFNKLAILLMSASIVLIVTSKVLLQLFVHRNFHDAWIYMPFLYLAAIFYAFGSFYAVGFHCAKKNMGSCYTAGLGALTNIVCNIILIPLWGIQGAAFATFLSYLVLWLGRLYWTRNYFDIRIEWPKFLTLGLSSLTIAVFTCFYQDFVAGTLLIIISITVFLCYNYSLMSKVCFVMMRHFRHAN